MEGERVGRERGREGETERKGIEMGREGERWGIGFDSVPALVESNAFEWLHLSA